MRFSIVCFDCDSTLSRIEGIDELAKQVGLGEEMARLTDAAMNGELPLEAIYEKRLALIKPEQKAIEHLARQYIEERVEGVVEVINQLQTLGLHVHIISGGLRQAILPLAEYLSVPAEHVHAVDVFYNGDGSYQGYDRESPLARSGGKAEVCTRLSNEGGSLVMIGDGQTDLESKAAGAYFIGFGGVVERAAVREQADDYITGPSLSPVMHLIC